MNAPTGSSSAQWATGFDVLTRLLEGLRAIESLGDAQDAVADVLDDQAPPRDALPGLDALLRAGLGHEPPRVPATYRATTPAGPLTEPQV